MAAAAVAFCAAVVFCLVASAFALRPASDAVAPLRLAIIRASLVLGGYAVVSLEVLSLVGALTGTGVAVVWTAAVVLTAGAAAFRYRRDASSSATAPATPRRSPWTTAWPELNGLWRRLRRLGWLERLLIAGLALLTLLELLVALVAEPNTYDSQTYHLPKVERWVHQGSLEFFPTGIHRQITHAPGAEYLLVYPRLVTGGDALHNLLQWAALIGCLLAVSRIAAQLGATARGQLIAAAVAGTAPMAVLQATSTQTDLVVAAWLLAGATLVVDGLLRPATLDVIPLLGLATGLTALTKATGLLGLSALLVVWGLAQLRFVFQRRSRPVVGVAQVAAWSVTVIAVGLVIAGPYLWRSYTEWGHVLGPEYLRESQTLQRHDPGALVINALRWCLSVMITPWHDLNYALVSIGLDLSAWLGVDPEDPSITFPGSRVGDSWYLLDEDHASYPLQSLLAFLGLVAGLYGRRVPGRRGYAVAVLAMLVAFWVTLRWQTWGSRLVLPVLILCAPLAGVWLDRVLRGVGRTRPHRWALPVVSVLVAALGVSGLHALAVGEPRPLLGAHSVLTADEWETRFVHHPHWQELYQWAADEVRASGAERVGIVEHPDAWEYPWWLLLGDLELVPLQSALPHHPPESPDTVDALVCVSSPAWCEDLAPDGWTVRYRGEVGIALP